MRVSGLALALALTLTACRGEAPAPTLAPAPYRSSPPPSAEPSGPSSGELEGGGPTGPAAALRDRPAVPTPTPTPEATAAPKPDPEWWRDAVAYEIFVRSFQDSDGDGIGDFRGIIERLDHLERLGVTLVWLMPIHPSPSYHGYDVTDYLAVNPEYGTMEDFENLLAEGKKRNIRFIIDWVLNHSSDKHPWFLESRRGPTLADGTPNPRYDWYVWRESKPAADEGWARPWDGAPLWHELSHQAGSRYYYGLFWSGMPDLNVANPEVQRAMEDGMRFWLDKGLAGFRVDAIRYLIEVFKDGEGHEADTAETHAYLKGVRERFARSHPEALMVGEIWSSADDQAGYYGDGDMLHMAFSFDMASALIETSRDGVRSRLNQMIERSAKLFGRDRGFEAPFLTNHDMARVARLMNQDTARLKVAAALMLASPGTPFIYYGEEIGMIGGADRADENKRTPMRWNARADQSFGFTTGRPWWTMGDEPEGVDVETQLADPSSLLNHYVRLIAARNGSRALRRGDQLRLEAGVAEGASQKGLIAFLRSATEPDGRQSRVLVIANVDADALGAVTVELPASTRGGLSTARTLAADGVEGVRVEDGRVHIGELAPRSWAWVAID